MHPVLTGRTGGDDHFLQLVVLVVFNILRFHFGTAGHGGEHVVQYSAQLGCGDVGTVLGHTHIGSLFTLGRSPSGDGNLLGQTVFKHDALEVVDCVLSIETHVHLASPVKDRCSIGEIDVGSLHHTLFLVIVEGCDGNVSTNINPFGGDIDTIGNEDGGEHNTPMLLYNLVGKECFVIDRFGFVSHRSKEHFAGFHAGLIVQRIAIGKTTTRSVVNGGTRTGDGFALDSDWVERCGAAFPSKDWLDK